MVYIVKNLGGGRILVIESRALHMLGNKIYSNWQTAFKIWHKFN
jgi:hypothetical protein